MKTSFFSALIIDNEQKICDIIKIFLDSTDIFSTLVTANNVLQATQKIQNQYFDLIIVDHAMPGKSGIEFIHNLIVQPKYFGVHFLLISGALKRDDVLTAMRLGINNIMVKPFSREQLTRKVTDILIN